MNTQVRDGAISQAAAMKQMAGLLAAIKDYYYGAGGKQCTSAEWVFPVEGYGPKAIGGTGDKGYKAGGYRYFDGNRHGGHPSFDIFIRDRNRDDLDDGARRPVRVLSMTGGIVVARETAWDRNSRLRGGVYLWIYSPSEEALVYYAHNREVHVGVGDIVRPGDPVATVGRTGLNAHKTRSPTHLHLTFLKAKDGHPVPVNIYAELLKRKP